MYIARVCVCVCVAFVCVINMFAGLDKAHSERFLDSLTHGLYGHKLMLVLSHCVSGYQHASSMVRAVRTYWADKEGRELDEDSAL